MHSCTDAFCGWLPKILVVICGHVSHKSSSDCERIEIFEASNVLTSFTLSRHVCVSSQPLQEIYRDRISAPLFIGPISFGLQGLDVPSFVWVARLPVACLKSTHCIGLTITV